MSIRGALPCMKLSPYTDKEWETLPHTILTSYKGLDPPCIDCEGQLDNEEWLDNQSSFPDISGYKSSMSMGSVETHPTTMSYTYLMQKPEKKTL